MSFFNKKEEVINIELTSYGKRLLGLGKFKPVYYSFFDDDIIYDYEWAGITEQQSEIQTRITSSATLKPQVVYTDLGVKARQVIFENRSLDPHAPPAAYTILPDIQQNDFVYAKPLGKSSLSSEYAPAWSILVNNSPLSSSSPSLTGSYENLPIPQLNANVDFDLRLITPRQRNQVTPGGSILREYDVLRDFDDGTMILLRKRDVVLQIIEQHTDFQRENFDFEVFEITSSVNDGTSHYPESQFCFTNDDIPNDIVVEGDPSFIEYFLDIIVDDEIDQQTLCDMMTKSEERNRFEATPPACSDTGGPATNENVYDLPVNSDDQTTYCDD
jgi:hypothetical protein